ncbi:MAG: M6 family metalloprotease domain-containing protein [Myxococcales bacterium]|nr:M6 family metalloprotease domain-containing protein [Myxococcales bacterium]
MRTNPLALLAVAAALASPPPTWATQPPAPGVLVPPEVRANLERIKSAPIERGLTRSVARAAAARAAAARGIQVSPALTAVTGTYAVPVVPVLYANTGGAPYAVSNLQTELFDGTWPTGTMTEHYAEMSYGALTVTGTVYGWTSLGQNDTYYEGGGSCKGLCGSAKVGELITTSVAAIDGSVDFGQYDNDGPDGNPNSGDDDGYVDFIAFVHPEAGGECGNSNIWSHRWTLGGWGLGAYSTNDDSASGGKIKIYDYVIQPALACDGGTMIQIGVFSHEFGHAFGLPDFYDTDSSSEGDGNWALMASGSWGGNGAHPEKPSHMMAWSKQYLGWLTPTTVSNSTTGVSVAQAETNAAAIKIPFTDGSSSEYFLIENRQQTGFDQYVPAGGLLIWHIDEAKWTSPSNNANTSECIDGPGVNVCGSSHYTVALEQADGSFHLEQKSNRGDSGDPFRSGYKTTFTPSTTPWSRDYSNGSSRQPTITNISASGSTMTFDLSLPAGTPCPPTNATLLTGDFNGDGESDIAWRNTSTGGLVFWIMNGQTITSSKVIATVDTNLVLKATGDFDGDGKSDLLWRNPSTGRLALWLMNGFNAKKIQVIGNVSTALSVQTVGDLDGDGRDDITWRHGSTGTLAIWLMNGISAKQISLIPNVSQNIELHGSGDLNGDGRRDLLWRNPTTGRLAIWFMNGVNAQSISIVEGVQTAIVLQGSGDLDGDGKDDLIWRNPSNGVLVYWLMNAASAKSITVHGAVSTSMALDGLSDHDGDGKMDLLWRNTSSNAATVWLMNGATASRTASVGADCDTSVNWGPAPMTYDENMNLVACDAPDEDGDGWTICGGDCDDADPHVHPGGADLPGNGLDEDCDGADATSPLCAAVPEGAGGAWGLALYALPFLAALRGRRRVQTHTQAMKKN